MLQRTQVRTTESTLASLSGSASAEPWTRWTGARDRLDRRTARCSNSGEGSTPTMRSTPVAVEREVQARPDPDLQHEPARRWDQHSTVSGRLVTPHRPVDEAGQDPIRVDAHVNDACETL